MPRLSEERHQSNLRVSKVEVAVAKAVGEAWEEGITYLEIVQGLGAVQQAWINRGRIEETP